MTQEIDIYRKPCEGIKADGAACKHMAKDGNNLCGWCIRTLRDYKPVRHMPKAKDKAEATARRLLHDIIKSNNIAVEVPEWDGEFDPFEQLLLVAQELTGWKEICLAKVAKLKEDEWRWDGDRAGEQLRSEIVLYERAVKDAADLLIKIARLGIEERMMRIAERQQAIVETAIIRTLQELDIPLETQAKARVKIISHLRLASN